MLVYYILSGGHHPFGKGAHCEINILDGKYSLEHLEDDVAKDLVEWMINEDLPDEIVQKVDSKKKPYPENLLGLLRFIRNLYEHYSDDAEKTNLMTIFPDLFGNAFKFAKVRGWHTTPSLRKWLRSAPVI
ncbi:hypothetical protein AOLI_G00110290 [Acnodon oligacanthus]